MNKLGITDKDALGKAEADITAVRLALLTLKPAPGKLDYNYLKEIHRSLFEGLYDWAGKERTVQTVNGFSRFEWPDNIKNKLRSYLLNLEVKTT